MERDQRIADPRRLAQGMDPIVLLAQAPLQHRQALGGHVIGAHAGARMVPVAVGDHRTRHRPPGIDVEVAGRAVQALRRVHHQVVPGHQRVLSAG